MQAQNVQAEARGGVSVAAHRVNLAANAGTVHQHAGGDNHAKQAKQRERQAIVIAIRAFEREPTNAVHKPVREAIQPGTVCQVNQQAIEQIQRGNGDDDGWHPQPVDQKTVNQPEQQTDAHRHGKGQWKAATVVDDVTRHHVLTDGGDCREGDINTSGNQHHKQAAGQNTENGIAGGDVGQVAEGQELVGPEAKANCQYQHQ